MVSTVAPLACNASIVQDFNPLPLTWTTQAPHCEVSQPTWVPVRRKFSRRNCTSKVRGSMSAVTALPFTVIETVGMTLLLEMRADGPLLAPMGGGHARKGAKSRRFPRDRACER